MAVAERDRWPLWLPVALGAGAGLYFALPAEPAPGAGMAALAVGLAAAALAILGWRRVFTRCCPAAPARLPPL